MTGTGECFILSGRSHFKAGLKKIILYRSVTKMGKIQFIYMRFICPETEVFLSSACLFR